MTRLTQESILDNVIKSRELTEENLRKQVAYLYRIFDFYGWCDLIVTHISAKIPNEDALIILPFGLSFKEVTPDNLIKVNFSGDILESSHNFDINHNGTTVHRAIYRNDDNISCILHTHSHYGTTVSNLEEELMLLDQIGMMFYEKVGYHEFDTLFINDNEQNKLLEDMQGKNCMILKNHGLLTIGKTIAEAFWYHYYLELTCKIQVLTMSTGGNIKFPSSEAVKSTVAKYDKWRNSGDHVGITGSEYLFEAAKRQVGYIFG